MFLFRDFELKINTEIRVSLIKIYGVGWTKALKVCAKIGFALPYKFNKINLYQFYMLSFLLKLLTLSDARIKRQVNLNIGRMMDNGSCKGLRHKLCLPVHGQRTRTNACTQRTKRIKRINFLGK